MKKYVLVMLSSFVSLSAMQPIAKPIDAHYFTKVLADSRTDNSTVCFGKLVKLNKDQERILYMHNSIRRKKGSFDVARYETLLRTYNCTESDLKKELALARNHNNIPASLSQST